jgi:hypothetical protein
MDFQYLHSAISFQPASSQTVERFIILSFIKRNPALCAGHAEQNTRPGLDRAGHQAGQVPLDHDHRAKLLLPRRSRAATRKLPPVTQHRLGNQICSLRFQQNTRRCISRGSAENVLKRRPIGSFIRGIPNFHAALDE